MYFSKTIIRVFFLFGMANNVMGEKYYAIIYLMIIAKTKATFVINFFNNCICGLMFFECLDYDVTDQN